MYYFLSRKDLIISSSQQILYGRKHVAVISLLLVATANLTSASPVLSDDSPAKKVIIDFTC